MESDRPAWLRAIPDGLVIALARVGPVGRIKPAPGTWGSVAGMLYFLLIFHRTDWITTILGSLVAAMVAVVACGEAEHRLGKQDPGEIVLDEAVAIPLCFLGWTTFLDVAPAWVIWLAGFALFRLFDVTKPLGIAALQKLPGGWGVVIDDLAAALLTCATLHAAFFAWTAWS